MPKIIFDTATGSSNLGDFIIMDSVNEIVNELFKNEFLLHIPTHLRIHPLDVPMMRKYELGIVSGTNLLKNDQLFEGQWKIDFTAIPFFQKKAVLLGVGWWQYQPSKPSIYTKWFYNNLLSKNHFHSVRDGYTKLKLAEMGIDNVINTGCPTVWKLTPDHCADIPKSKSRKVITTITDYLRDPIRDKKMLETLQENYEEVFVWLQGSKDEAYVKSLTSGLQIVGPKLSLFDRFLENEECDYVGTRLHAGIRALQKKRRCLIIGIDNRALEMQKDIGLPVLDRKNIEQLQEWIEIDSSIELNVNWSAIEQWKKQFNSI